MDAAKASLPSPLHKPLHELTDEDIAQVTREDCRRFLKEKGMRRPSWNKSQAIQQVISLKALLESKPRDDEDENDRHVLAAHTTPFGSNQHPSTASHTSSSLPSLVASAHTSSPPAAAGADSRQQNALLAAIGPQMTIFYNGEVNVYDVITPEKAVAIMKVAAGLDASQGGATQTPICGSCPLASWPPPVPSVNHLPPLLPKVLPYLEDSTGRRASIQRYLDKRKDRKIFKWKRTLDGLTLSDFDLIFSQKAKPHLRPGHQYGNDAVSLLQHLPQNTPALSCFIENLGQTDRLSIDLNEDVTQDV